MHREFGSFYADRSLVVLAGFVGVWVIEQSKDGAIHLLLACAGGFAKARRQVADGL